MGFLSKLIGGEAISLATGVADIVDRFMETPDEKRAAAQWLDKAQNEINALAQGHRNWFVSGPRPAILWVCAISLFFYFVPQYVLGAILWTKASWAAEAILPYPVSADGLFELTGALLGLATLRTIEKRIGKTK